MSTYAEEKLHRIQQRNKNLREHILAVDNNGFLIDPVILNRYSKKEADEYLKNIVKTINALPEEKEIFLFIHGGMNTEEDGFENANALIDSIVRHGYFPLFINWNTGFLSSYGDNLFHIRNGEYEKGFLACITSPFVIVQDIGSAAASSLISTYQLFTKNKIVYSNISKPEKEMNAGIEKAKSTWKELFSSHIFFDSSIAIPSTWSYVTSLNPIKPVANIFVYGLGGKAWKVMKRRTELLFHPDKDFSVLEPQKIKNQFIQPDLGEVSDAGGVVAQFFKELGSHKKLHERKLTIVGHSMGTMVCNTILKRYPSLNYRNIIYMGAACSISDIEYSVVPMMLKNDTARFYNFMLHEYNEILEDDSFTFAPKGSLLHWIDIMFEDPQTFNQRTAGSWINFSRALSIFPDTIRSRVYSKTFSFEGDVPHKHIDFNDYLKKYPLFWKID